MTNVQIEVTGNAEKFFRDFPDELKDAQRIALDDIGMIGSGFMKNVMPVKTGNLRRSATWSGEDNFPFFAPREDDYLPEFGNSSLADVKDTVFIGTNVVYAFPMDKLFDFADMTMQYLEQNVIERVFDREIDRKLEKS